MEGEGGGGGLGSNPLSSKEVTMATEPQHTSRHLSTQHRKPVSVMNTYPKCEREGGREGGRERSEQALQVKCKQKHMTMPLQTCLEPST